MLVFERAWGAEKGEDEKERLRKEREIVMTRGSELCGRKGKGAGHSGGVQPAKGKMATVSFVSEHE